MSYDTRPCKGRPASPSNPSGPQTARLDETVVMRCTTEEKRHLKRRGAADKISVSELSRGVLGQIKAPRVLEMNVQHEAGRGPATCELVATKPDIPTVMRGSKLWP